MKPHTLQQLIGYDASALAKQDHSGSSYFIEGDHLNISLSGNYSIAELQEKLAQVMEAQRLYKAFGLKI